MTINIMVQGFMSTDFDRIPMRITTHLLDNRTQKSQVILGIDCVKWLLI